MRPAPHRLVTQLDEWGTVDLGTEIADADRLNIDGLGARMVDDALLQAQAVAAAAGWRTGEPGELRR